MLFVVGFDERGERRGEIIRVFDGFDTYTSASTPRRSIFIVYYATWNLRGSYPCPYRAQYRPKPALIFSDKRASISCIMSYHMYLGPGRMSITAGTRRLCYQKGRF